MRAFLFCLVLGAAATARAQQSPPPTTILFVGNSFTYGGSTKVHAYNAAAVTDELPGEQGVGGIPAIFKKFTEEAGLHYEVHVETVGGKTLEYHYQNARNLLAQGKWDAVVLQGLSTEPLPTARGGKPENFLRSAAALENLIHQARPTTKIYLYETWAYPFKSYPASPTDPLAWRSAMSSDLRNGYERAFSAVGHFEAVAPVGDAFLKFAAGQISRYASYTPQVPLLDTDSKHPNVQGSYLSAAVLFRTITGTSIARFGVEEKAARDLNIPLGDTAALQEAADETARTVHHTPQGIQTIQPAQSPTVARP